MLSNKAIFINDVPCTYSSFRFVCVAKILSGKEVIALKEKSLYDNSKSHDLSESASELKDLFTTIAQ